MQLKETERSRLFQRTFCGVPVAISKRGRKKKKTCLSHGHTVNKAASGQIRLASGHQRIESLFGLAKGEGRVSEREGERENVYAINLATT